MDHPRLRAVEEALDRGELDEAQQLLSGLGEVDMPPRAVAYLTTRLLYQRGRLDAQEVAERLVELADEPDFPQARALYGAAEHDHLETYLADRAATAAWASLSEPPEDTHAPEATQPPTPSRSIPSAGLLASVPSTEPPHRFAPSARPPGFAWSSAPSESMQAATGDRTDSRPASTEAPRTPDLPQPQLPAELVDLEPRRSELIQLLRGGEYARACALVEQLPPHGDPQLTLLYARALAGSGHRDAAKARLRRLANTPLLDPVIRIDVAGQLIALGDPEQAYQQAALAHEDEPHNTTAQLTLAWAIVRATRRQSDASLMQRASQLLRDAQQHGLEASEDEALANALRACVEGRLGTPERAIALAQNVLARYPDMPDAYAALVHAHQRSGRESNARLAWERLEKLAPDEAEALRRQLEVVNSSPTAPGR